MSDEDKKKTGLFHDSDGNIDDARVAAWFLVILLVWLSYQAVVQESGPAMQIVEAIIWPIVLLFGVETAEKFKGKLK